MKYYEYDIYFNTVKEELEKWCINNKIKYQIINQDKMWHFKIRMTKLEMKNANDFLNQFNQLYVGK